MSRAFIFTEAQREDLAHAAMCKAEELMGGHEAQAPEVQEAIVNLWESYRILDGGTHVGSQS